MWTRYDKLALTYRGGAVSAPSPSGYANNETRLVEVRLDVSGTLLQFGRRGEVAKTVARNFSQSGLNRPSTVNCLTVPLAKGFHQTGMAFTKLD